MLQYGPLPAADVPEIMELAAKYSLVDFLARYLTPGFTDDDILLEVVIINHSSIGGDGPHGRFWSW